MWRPPPANAAARGSLPAVSYGSSQRAHSVADGATVIGDWDGESEQAGAAWLTSGRAVAQAVPPRTVASMWPGFGQLAFATVRRSPVDCRAAGRFASLIKGVETDAHAAARRSHPRRYDVVIVAVPVTTSTLAVPHSTETMCEQAPQLGDVDTGARRQ
jgi:hypothetical protein